MIMMLNALALAGCLPALLARSTALAPTRAGWLFYYPNLLDDWTVKRLGFPRPAFGLALFAAGAAWIAFRPGWGIAAAALLVMTLLVLMVLNGRNDRAILHARASQPDSRWVPPTGPGDELPEGAGPHPACHPDLTLTMEGPFLRRLPNYDLGDLFLGREVRIGIVLANHSTVPGQVPSDFVFTPGAGLEARIDGPVQAPPLKPGQVLRTTLVLRASRKGGKTGLRLAVRHADREIVARLGVRSVFADDVIVEAKVSRYPGGRRAAFAWRGDMDHYDRASFQSIEGLERTLGLAARYRFPQTMYLSSRLCLDESEARTFYNRFGVDRGADEIPAFIHWMREKVELRHSAPYPFDPSKPYCLELGNHMHLHYGTDASSTHENGWTRQARMGAGPYTWQGSDRSSFGEQRDNALECRRRMEKALGFTPLSWAMPDSTRDSDTPRAVEAAGCLVTSDVDAGPWENVLSQPPPHHPMGTDLVELTKRYPGDPEDGIHVAMILYWVHRAWRQGIPVVYMGHQHLRQFNGEAGLRCTEALLRHILHDFHGDLWIDTVFGVGSYWGQALSPRTGSIGIECRAGQVRVRHGGKAPLTAVPVDVRTRGGRQFTVLTDLPAARTVVFGLEANVHPHP
jgi:hypothetical protein